jgi:hypothetical protein
MVDSKWCKEIPQEQIKIAHFTGCAAALRRWACLLRKRCQWWVGARGFRAFAVAACQKPWYCITPSHANCGYLTEQWWAVSRSTEKELLLTPRKRCHVDPGAHDYETIAWPA